MFDEESIQIFGAVIALIAAVGIGIAIFMLAISGAVFLIGLLLGVN